MVARQDPFKNEKSNALSHSVSGLTSAKSVGLPVFTCPGGSGILEVRPVMIESIKEIREKSMSILVEFSIVPMGKGVSVSPVVARVMKIVVESGISYKANPMGTVLEGEWDRVMDIIKECHQEVMKDADRAVTSIKIDDRKGKEERIGKKVESVEQKLGMKLQK